MKVILNKDVANLGEEGDVCEVASGYARNFLLPHGLVLEHNARNVARLEERRADIEARKDEKRREAQSLKERLEAEPLAIEMTAGTNGRLFGSVTSATIAEHLAANGIEIERRRIEIAESSLKAVGTYRVRIKLYGGEEASLQVKVSASNARELEERRRDSAPDAEPAAAAPPEEPDAPPEEDNHGLFTADDDILDPEMIAMRAAQAEEDGEDALPDA